MYRPYTEHLTKEEKLKKAKEALRDSAALVAHLDDRGQEQFFKLLSKRLSLEYGEFDLAAWALDEKRAAHLRRVTA